MDTSEHPSIAIRGPYFWKNNERFFVRGVVYQASFGVGSDAGVGPVDPIADDRISRLEHDIALLKELGVNTIFVYAIDHTKEHTQALKMLVEAGIYIFTSVSPLGSYINRSAPHTSYHADFMDSCFRIVDIMSSCPNTLGVLVADALVTDDDDMPGIPVMAAMVRDLKKYVKLKNETSGLRRIPIGYGADTIEARDVTILDYLSSGDEADRIDFFTCKYYPDSNGSSPDRSRLSVLVERFLGARIPIFFSEYSSATHQTRSFAETEDLFSPHVTLTLSGGCVYEFWQCSNGYGLARLHDEKDKLQSLPGVHLGREDLRDIRLIRDREISETRHTAQGTLLIYQDFANYKASLRATSVTPHSSDRGASEDSLERTPASLEAQYPQTFKYNGPDLESCVDWSGI